LRFMDLSPRKVRQHYSTIAVVDWLHEALSDVRSTGVRELEA
jgi:hypothetical protein